MRYVKRINLNKNLLSLGLILTSLSSLLAQENSKNNYAGNWTTNSSWVDNSAPAYTSIGSTNQNLNIYGYITLGSYAAPVAGMTFAANKDAYTFTIYDTLVVFGDVSFGNQAMDLRLGAGALLIVFGDLTLNNKIDINSTGNIVVTGTFEKQGAANQGSYTGGGNIYAGGFDIPGTWVPVADQKNTGSDLQNDLPDIYDFIQNNGSTPLPIELFYFRARVDKLMVTLDWATASEENFDFFDIERSENGVEFKSIGSLSGNGGKGKLTRYSLIDNLETIGRYYYRLKSVDLDRSFEYSKIIAVTTQGFEDTGFIIYPNPTITEDLFYIDNSNPGQTQLILFDQLGKSYFAVNLKSGKNAIPLHHSIPNGMYFVKFVGSNTSETSKLILTR